MTNFHINEIENNPRTMSTKWFESDGCKQAEQKTHLPNNKHKHTHTHTQRCDEENQNERNEEREEKKPKIISFKTNNRYTLRKIIGFYHFDAAAQQKLLQKLR